jgi:hypothetical protein
MCVSERGALPIEQLAGVQPRAEQPEPGVHAWETRLAGRGSWLASQPSYITKLTEALAEG